MRETISADNGWKFHLGDIGGQRNRWAWGKSGSWNQGPESFDFDDSSWREVQLPHDFVIESTPEPSFTKELDGNDNAIPEMQTISNIHTAAGSFHKDVGWYRKHFYIPAEDEGRKIYFRFDGIYRDSMIFVNNFFVKHHRSGYAGVCCDITDFVNYGGENVISVRADAREAEGWFYEGGGIYRHAYIIKTEPEHIRSLFIKARPENGAALVEVQADVCGGDKLALEVFSPEGQPVCAARAGCGSVLTATIEDAKLWDIDTPYLYTAKICMYSGEKKTDEVTETFGVRSIRFDADEGFFLNGRRVKLKGVCCHQNHGGLGAALPDEMYEYRIKKLKEMGANAYRCSHYPPSPALLAACDRMGMLVMDETRLLSSNEEDMSVLRYMVESARNHPSVILYSIGNEEAQSQALPQGGRIAGSMIDAIRELDDTRPVTMALLMWDLANKKPIESTKDLAAISEKLDVAGFNYHENRWEEFHRTYPTQPMICTEQKTFKSTRGCYKTEPEKCRLSITDKSCDSYMEGASCWRAAKADWMSGLFLWTGFDYYGEPTPFAWPAIMSQFGIMDICGYPKDFYYYYRACWSGEDVIHLFPHWNGIPGEKKDVHVFSNAEEVELFVNGQSLGRKRMMTDDYLEWEGVEFQPGEIRACGWRGGRLCMEDVVRTTKAASAVNLTADFVKNGLAVIRIEAVDEDGRIVPDGDMEVEIRIKGNGRLLGTANGDPADHTPAHSAKRRIFNGLMQAIVSFEGDVEVYGQSSLPCGCVRINSGEN